MSSQSVASGPPASESAVANLSLEGQAHPTERRQQVAPPPLRVGRPEDNPESDSVILNSLSELIAQQGATDIVHWRRPPLGSKDAVAGEVLPEPDEWPSSLDLAMKPHLQEIVSEAMNLQAVAANSCNSKVQPTKKPLFAEQSHSTASFASSHLNIDAASGCSFSNSPRKSAKRSNIGLWCRLLQSSDKHRGSCNPFSTQTFSRYSHTAQLESHC